MSNKPYIFCDESGFTGNHLSNPDQPYFSFSAVHISEEEAAAIVGKLRDATGMHSHEPKASKLLRSARGRANIIEVLQALEGKRKVIVSDKLFGLSGKFYEYIFEPLLAAKCGLFYEVNFHRFISNLLYGGIRADAPLTKDLLLEFETGMRKGDFRAAPMMNGSLSLPMGHAFDWILEFCRIHINDIHEESAFPGAEGYERWILDLSSTSIHSLLAAWCQEVGEMSVICDDSKPLLDCKDIIEAFGNCDEVPTMRFQGVEHHLGYKLDGPIQFQQSDGSDGLILADIVASSMTWCMKHQRDGQKIRDILLPCILGSSMLPDLDHADLKRPEPVANNILLGSLLERSRAGVSLLNGIEYEVAASRELGSRYIREMGEG